MVALKPPVQARSVATRAKLVAAAAQVLATHGYRRATTQAVADAAGVSQGALFKHFPTKGALLAACVEHILAGFVAAFRAEGATPRRRATTLAARVRPAVAGLWRIFRRPAMHAVFEVYVAARTDPELERALAPILERHRDNILAEARRLFPELARHPELDSVVDAVVYAMQGVVLGLFAPDATTEAAHLAFFERLAVRELEAVTGSSS